MEKIIFVGDVALDEYYQADRFPKLADKISVETLPAQAGGMIANAAAVYASYAGHVEFCAVLNDSPVSKMLCEDLNRSNVGTKYVMTDRTLPDSKTIIILAQDEHTVFIPNLHVTEIPLDEEAYQALLDADVVYSNIHEIKYLKYKDLDAHAIISNMKQNGCRFAFDLDVADFREGEIEYLKYIDYIFVNEIGFHSLSAVCGGEVEKTLFGNGTKIIVKTVAEKGAQVITPEETHTIDGLEVPVEDVTGAGDTFCSSFLYALGLLDDYRLAGEFANYAAARSVGLLGARSGAVGIQMVLDYIEQAGGKAERFKKLSGREELWG